MVPNYLLILTLAVAVSARTATNNHNTEEGRSSDDSILGDFKLAYETYKDCSGSELANCLKFKLAKALNRISRSDEISVLNGVTITKDKDAEVENNVVEEAIPRGLDDSSLDNLIFDKILGFMRSHTVQIKFPGSELSRAFDEGRARRKKLAPLLAIPLLIGGMMVPLAFGALALLAGKALIVSKLALVLAGIIGLKKLLSPSGGGHESHEVVVSAGHAGSGWSRYCKAYLLISFLARFSRTIGKEWGERLKTERVIHCGHTLSEAFRRGSLYSESNMIRCGIVLLLAASAWSMPAADKEAGDAGLVNNVLGVVKDCVENDVSLCLKEKALKYVETLSSAREMSLADGVTLIGNGSPRSARALEPLSEEPKAREAQIESRLVDTAADLLENHIIQFRMPSSAVEGMKRSLEEARGKKKKLKSLIPLLAIAKLKITALIPLFLGIIAFAAAKAVLLAKIALLVAGIIALKKLLASKHHETSYEVVAHPHHAEEHYASSGHGWSRSIDDAQDLAYNAHVKTD